MKDATLIQAAREMLKNAYAPYSKFQVGAALLTKTNKIYTGANVENVSFGGCVCGERVAVFKAVVDGERSFDTIAIASSSEDLVLPCGICRQVLSEFADEKLRVLCTDKQGTVRTYTLGELLPHAFTKFS